MQSGDLRLGELICTRVCHDLSGLAGTLVGTLELAQDELGDEALALARETALALSRRLKLLRAAFGPISEPMRPSDIADLASGIGDRLRVDASGLRPDPVPAEQARLALAMILLCAEASPSGAVEIASGAQGALRTVARCPRAAWRPDTLRALDGDVPATPSTVLAPFCALLAQHAGMSFSVERSPPALSAAQYGGVRQRGAGTL